MTTAELETKIDELLVDLIPAIKTKCLSLARSGGIDLASYENNFIVPKILLTVVLADCSTMYRPLHPDHRAVVESLKHV